MTESRAMEFRAAQNTTPINAALNNIVSRGQQSSRHLVFECDENFEMTRRSAEKRKDDKNAKSRQMNNYLAG